MRPASYRAKCLNNMHQLAIAFENFEGAWRRFPASCRVEKDPETGQVSAMNGMPGTGWSWCVDLLPYLGHGALHSTLDIQGGYPTEAMDDPTHPNMVAMGQSMDISICPAFAGDRYVNPKTERETITNYKAMTATHIESYLAATDQPAKPLYGEADIHPDGAIYPGSKHGHTAFAGDGYSNTILLAETTEQYRSRWMIGTEAAVVGIPARDLGGKRFFDKKSAYYHPRGYTPDKWDSETTIPAKYNRTYLNWDYEETPYYDSVAERGASDDFDSNAVFYGPSSHHPGVVNHVFADGSARSISVDIDAAAYMFMITRAGGDSPPKRW